ncbi:granzyme H-like [Equus quagga]|uniref:granzyme H-like n=1 Tax=Equus quagga TaxID=89248 RepID=UPI001EE1C92B|nr:granzyme H-like [Equus quagga]
MEEVCKVLGHSPAFLSLTKYLEGIMTNSSDLGSLSRNMHPLLLLLAFLLPSEPAIGIVIGGHEVRPHSRPYMSLVQARMNGMVKTCGGVLVDLDGVMTAAHCWGSSVSVTLGAHDILNQEWTLQVIPVKEAIRHPDYIPGDFFNDIMILKLERKAKLTAAVRPLSISRGTAQVCRPRGSMDSAICTLCPQGDSGSPLICKNML